VVGGGTIDFNYDKWTTDNPVYSGYHINLPGSTALSNCYITNPPPRIQVKPSVRKRRPGGSYLYDLTRCDPTETVPSSESQVKETLQNTQRQKRKYTEEETKDANLDKHAKSHKEERMELRSPEVRVPPPPPKATQTKQKTLSPSSSSSSMINQSNSKIGNKNAQPRALPDPPVGSQLVRKRNTADNSETALIQALSADSQLTTVVSTVNSKTEM